MCNSLKFNESIPTLNANILSKTNKHIVCTLFVHIRIRKKQNFFKKAVFRIRISFNAGPDPDPGSQKCPYGSRTKYKLKYYKRILTFILPVLYLPNEPVHFLGFYTSWNGSRRHFFMRISARTRSETRNQT